MYFLNQITLLIFLLPFLHAWWSGSKCSQGKKRCEWMNWEEWDSCSVTCGGGTQYRRRGGMCCDTDWSYDECLHKCGKSRSEGHETRTCNNFCLNGVSYRNGCTCPDDKYGYCCQNFTFLWRSYNAACPSIAHCSQVRCSSSWDNICTKCDAQGSDKNSSVYWPISAGRKCEATCSYDGRWCWPGSCRDNLNDELDGLIPSCECHDDFRSTSGAKCELKKKPSLETCRATLTSTKGEMKNTITKGACMNEGSVYVNFHPVSMKFTFEMSFSLNITQPVPHYIQGSNFGIVDGSLLLKKYQINGVSSWNQIYTLNSVGDGCSESFQNTNPLAKIAHCNDTKVISVDLKDGEWLCPNFKAYAGGFLTYKTFTGTVSSKQIYSPTSESKEVCFRYDASSPVHCKDEGKCTKDPIQLLERIISNPNITVGLDGWFDPYPSGGKPSQASQIIQYEIAIHKISSVNQTMMRMEHNQINPKQILANETVREFEISLPGTTPSLYGISLSVLDTAGNVKMARSFVYFDNSSTLQIDHHYPFIFYTADLKTNNTWQTNHGKICMNWRDRYYNSHNVHDTSNVLRKIKSDDLYTGIYDQISGTLPVTGTPNVHGIVQFDYRFKLNHESFTSFRNVPNFTSQLLCETPNVKDGETYTFEIKSIDLTDKILTEKQVVFIDASVPDITNIWLERDGHIQLYVHNSTDLSRMTIEFDVLDLHSGIHSIQWAFGTTQHGTELGMGAKGVQRINGSCDDNINCYCPSVGVCEIFRYSIDLNPLVVNNTHIGQHHREYFFSVKATNNAQLVAIERIDILADDSPPEHGVVQEGRIGSSDVDFTSDDYVYVNWDGFIDHESGIKFYRVGLATTCLSQEILVGNETEGTIKLQDKTGLSTRFDNITPNKYFTTVIAFNNAMEPSKAVCSDGITIDITQPLLKNVILEHARTREVIGCYNRRAFLFLSNLTVIPLIMTHECLQVCNSSDEIDFISALPVGFKSSNDSDVASAMCSKLPAIDANWFIYLPSDKIYMSWNVSDLESQIRYVNVGFSSSATNVAAPDINGYQTVHSITKLRKTHSGIDRGKLFYIMLKATNKADLDNVMKVGPIIIDETEPEYTSGIDVIILDSYIYCTWNNRTFFDTEQKEELTSFLFRIGTGSHFVTPFLQAHIENQCPLKYATKHCFKYPLRRLQAQDSEKGHSYYLEIHVYNIAGHYLTVRSMDFNIPSVYPPGQGVVLDTTKNQINDNVDIDFISKTDTICGSWTGFRHHMNVTFYVGVGNIPYTDDKVNFTFTKNTKHACIDASGLDSFITYYFSVKASCSGGSTVASSDGFVIIDNTEVLLSLHVHNGKPCIHKKSEVNSKINNSTSLIPLTSEKIYTLLDCNNNSSLDDVIWLDRDRCIFKPSPTHSKGCEEKSNASPTCRYVAEKCFEEFNLTSSDHKMSFYWFLDSKIEKHVTNYEIVVYQASTNDAVSTTEFTEKHNSYEFQNLSLKNNQTFYAAVGVCFDSICIGPNKAEPFRVETNEPISRSVSAVMESKGVLGFVIELRFEAFTCTIGTAKGYNVALFKSETQNVQITKWHTLLSTSSTNIQEKVEFIEVIYPHSAPMLCIQAVCRSGNIATSCVKVESKEHANNFNKNVLYEVESGHFFERNVKSLVNAANIGSELSSLHRIEADFIRPGSKIFGVILNSAERTTEWFLMQKRETPSGPCRTDPFCTGSSVTREGYCQFNTMSLKHQVKYFICAVSNRSIIQREHLTDVLEETSSCGNGFVIDSEAPDPGSVKIVSNSNGFLTDTSYVHIVWEGFSDIEKQVNVPTLSGIANYKLALGSYPGGEDLFPYHNVGLRQSIFISPKPIKDGTQCFASIRAIDHVGHMTEVTSDGVIMDSTPPVNGTVIVGSGLYHLSVLSTKQFIVRWDSFKDPESGIRDFSISISESPDYTKSSHTVYSVTGDSFQLSETGNLLDGHTYFAVVEATNHAGLLSRSISEGFIIDSTAPEGGNVRDGLKDSRADLDFQEDVNVLGCHWDGFHDAHSKIISYEAGFGTKPSEFDITSQTNLGLHTQYIVHSRFTPGVKYYCTVIACNAASLCTTRTSDGIILDNSPPIPGIVRVGLSDRHQHYLGHSNLITAQWIGFQDPHSEIVHFKWCIGTVPSKCDIQDFQNCLLSDSITISNVKLREQTPHYITVEATNGVGLTTNRSSSSFMVETTPPYMTKRPVFVTKDKCVSHRDYTQFDNSVLFIEWSFDDDESHIADQTIILRSHHNGHVVKEKTVLWNQKWVTLKLDNENLLRSGDRYTAWVTACNGAGICATNSTEQILIDSSPPQLGGFHKGMKWRTLSESNTTFTELDLLWYGFTDVESGIVEYYVSISRDYSGAELSNGLLRVLHKSSNIQQTTVRLNETLQDTDKIVLSIWAENGVGLRSSVGKISVFLASSSKNHTGGFLEIERHSCDSHYCSFDCTCAVVGKKCTPPIKHLSCTNETDKQVTKINVTFGWIRTLSSSCLTLSWASENSSAIIKRYEWSLGIHNDVYGAGIFNTLHENIWNDVDKQNYVTHCLQYSRHLIHREKYVGYVRAWYSEDSYKIFTSLPILVDLTPPSIRKGASVLESIDGCVTDVDYMNSTYTFNICWRNVFVEREGEISKFSISGGTSPEGDDFLSTRDLPNSNLAFIITKPDMEKGKRYYFTITATNSLGLRSSKTSDGILIDEDKPVSGVIYNTPYHRSVRFQSSTQIGASWHGFDDHQSFIHHYSIILKESVTGNIVASTDTVGLSNTLKFKNMHLTHGKEYHFEMSAFDAVGHVSESVRSESVTIDTTPPHGLTCEDYDEGILLTPSNITQKSGILDKTLYTFKYLVDVRNGTLFKAIFNVSNSMTFRHLSLKLGKQNSILLHTVKKNNGCYHSEYQFISNGGKLLEMEAELFTDNLQTTLSKCGDVNQDTTEKVDVQQLSPTTFFVLSLVQDPESGIKEIIMSAGTTQSGYQILPHTHVSGMIYTFEAVVPHGTKLYPRAMVTNYAGLTTLFTARRPIVVDRTPPDIIVVSQNIEIVDRVKDGIENGSNIDNNVTSSAGLNNTMSTNNTNDNTALYIHLTSIKLKWKASDPESHLQDCLCSLGLFKGIQDVIGWTASEKENNTYTCSLTELDLNDGTTVFPSVKCINTVQLSNMINFEPMVVSYKAPVLSDAKIEFISQNEISADHETPIYPVQSNSSHVVFSWHGFHDESCHLTYETRLYQSGRVVQPWSSAGSRRLRSYDVGLGDWDNITVETRALNHGHIPSTPINASISIQTNAPRLTGKSASLTRTGNNFRLAWTDVFVNNVGGPYVFTVTMGRRDGQTDVQRPISTTGFFSEILSEEDIKEVYVTIKAMSVTGHEAAYRKTFLV